MEQAPPLPAPVPQNCPGTSSETAGQAAACAGCPNQARVVAAAAAAAAAQRALRGCRPQAACAQAPKGPDPDVAAIVERMRHIKHKVRQLRASVSASSPPRTLAALTRLHVRAVAGAFWQGWRRQKHGVCAAGVCVGRRGQPGALSLRHPAALAELTSSAAAAVAQVGLLDIDICGPSAPRMLGLEGEEVHQSSTGWSPVYVSDNLGVMSIGFMLTDPNDAVVWRGPRKNGLIKQFLKDVDWGTLDFLARPPQLLAATLLSRCR
jgi:Mrp family chromosome partitioning ATPase